ncbi:MAG: hypothetical protein NWF09_09320 [Candidatus Bathyarchaeota archaeon]|nr:hypothetical protein [Candidatus Bathyarchaeota archaeon]
MLTEQLQAIIELENCLELGREAKEAVNLCRYIVALEKNKILKTPAEKLVFLFLLFFQPQPFIAIRRCLNIRKNTLAKTLKSLSEKNILNQKDGLYFLTLQ